MAGITNTGFVSKRLPEILDSLRLNAQNRFGNTVNVQPDSVLGQLFDTTAAEIATLWQTIEATYASRDPAVAEDVLLDTLVYLNGLTRKPKDLGSVVVTPIDTGYPSFTTIPAGTTITEFNTGKVFTLDAAATPSLGACTLFTLVPDVGYLITTGDIWSVTIDGYTMSYTVLSGDTETEAANGLIAAIQAGTLITGWTAVYFFGVTSYSLNNVASNVYGFITGGYEDYTAVGIATQATPIVFDTIELPKFVEFDVGGGYTNVATALNTTPSIAGTEIESDVELRLRRQQSLSYAGTSTLDSIVAKVRSLVGVSSTIGYENTSNVTDAYSRPAKSFEIVVKGGINVDIAQTIYDFKPAGIETTFGDNAISNITIPIADENGTTHDIKFSKAYATYLHVRMDYATYDEERFLDSGANEIKRIIHDFSTGGEFQIGKDVIPQRFFGDIYSGVVGLQSLTMNLDTTVLSGDTPTYITDTVIPVGIREYVVLPIENILVCRKLSYTVSVTNGSPDVTINALDEAKIGIGDTVYFGLETSGYMVDSIAGTTVRMTTNYTGATNASQTMVLKRDY